MGLFNISKPNRENVKKLHQRMLESLGGLCSPTNNNDKFELKDAETYSRISEKANSEKIEMELDKLDAYVSNHKDAIERLIDIAASDGKYFIKVSLDINDDYEFFKISHLEDMEYFKDLKDLGFTCKFYFGFDKSVKRRNLMIKIKW